MSQPVVVSSTSGKTNTSTTASTLCNAITYPSGITLGDLLILIIGRGIDEVLSAGLPDGWEQLDIGTNASTCSHRVYWKFAGSTEVSGSGGAFPTLTMSASSYGYFAFLRINDCNPIKPPECPTVYAIGNSTTPNSPDATASWASSQDMMAITLYSKDDSRSVPTGNPPTNYTLVFVGAGGPATAGAAGLAFGVAYRTFTANNQEDPPAWPADAKTDTWTAQTILVRGLHQFSIIETLRLSNGDPVPNGVNVYALDLDSFLAAGVGDQIYIRAKNVVSGGSGGISLTVYSDGDKILIIDPDDVNMNGETLVTLPITPTPI
jgi:hypothetical protein